MLKCMDSLENGILTLPWSSIAPCSVCFPPTANQSRLYRKFCVSFKKSLLSPKFELSGCWARYGYRSVAIYYCNRYIDQTLLGIGSYQMYPWRSALCVHGTRCPNTLHCAQYQLFTGWTATQMGGHRLGPLYLPSWLGWSGLGLHPSRIVPWKGRYLSGPDCPQSDVALGQLAWGWAPRTSLEVASGHSAIWMGKLWLSRCHPQAGPKHLSELTLKRIDHLAFKLGMSSYALMVSVIGIPW